MEIRKSEFPVVVQAYDNTNQQERFIAEQVVNSQIEIDNFTSLYAGKLIKARKMTSAETTKHSTATGRTTRKSSSGLLWVLLLLVILVVVGFATGWIQRTFGIEI